MEKTFVGNLKIKWFQMEDLINILINNDYIVELLKENEDRDIVLINIYKKGEEK